MARTSTKTNTASWNGLTTNALKYIAIVAMVIDHIAICFVPDETALSIAMHFIGKITGPIMFFFAVEGYHRTHNIRKYMARLAVFALLSYWPFLYFRYSSNWGDVQYLRLNVLYAILLGVMAIHIRRTLKNPLLKTMLMIALVILCIPADWGTLGIVIIIVFDYFYGNFKDGAFAYCMIVLFDVGIFAVLARPFYSLFYGFEYNVADWLYMLSDFGLFLPILLLQFYNGKKGGNLPLSKWFFYIFYPLHLLILGFLRYILA